MAEKMTSLVKLEEAFGTFYDILWSFYMCRFMRRSLDTSVIPGTHLGLVWWSFSKAWILDPLSLMLDVGMGNTWEPILIWLW